MSNDWYNTSPAHNGLFGLAWGLGQANAQNQWHGYVQAYIAQGYTLEQAQALANNALGIRPKQPRKPMTARDHLVWATLLLMVGAGLTAAAFGIASSAMLVAGVVLVVFGMLHGLILGFGSK